MIYRDWIANFPLNFTDLTILSFPPLFKYSFNFILSFMLTE